MQEVSSSDFLPRTSAATRLLLQRHQQQVQAAFNDPRLLAIQNDGEAIMSSLRRDETVCCHSEDYRSVERRGGGGGVGGSGERRGEEVEREMRTRGEEGRGSRGDEDEGRGGRGDEDENGGVGVLVVDTGLSKLAHLTFTTLGFEKVYS